ncbi:unnamed protein product [Vicia faba]|uniref:non-specific serine/threonine protein kinase n=1 Tax=Vicia faba TaxID=3906 RepID=A0AAV0Z2C6_VICFA|nr:unnamed protein product [Vicia faba]
MIPFTLILFTLFSSVFSSSLLSDFHALVTLKQGFQFSNQVLYTWQGSNFTSVCSWAGIQCRDNRIVWVDLTDLNLFGSVSPSITSLDKLTHLSLAGNNLTGTIDLTNLTNLEFLNISNNMLSGQMDHWNLSTMQNLQVLDVYNNNFTSFLPLGLVCLKQSLKHLDLGGNFFFGEIPKSFGELASLEYLSLAGNDITGKIPGELGNLSNLMEIYLGYFNSFEGGIPVEFGKLRNLVHMDLSSCDLDGSIPKELGELKKLNTLYLHINQLSGSLPKHLANLTNLLYLDLSSNALTGEIPFEFINLNNLKLLNLFLNRLHGSIPDYIADFPHLETLGLWMNNFTGEIPYKLGLNGNIQVLDLSSNKLTGVIPPHLCSSNQLKILILLNNFLFGPIPQGLGTCYSLTRVRLGENYLNGSIPDGFLYLPKLNLAELKNNYLSGTLLENGNASSSLCLQQLDLSNNALSGPLPHSLSNFTSLQILSLTGNQFSGPIPSSIGGLNQVLKLDLSRNLLSGEIPPEIGNCLHLTYLDMSQNNLSGSIPPLFSNIRILNYLNLSRNHLNQTIPKSIGTMKSLTVADFSFNEFSGINSTPGKKTNADFKLIFALGLLMCSLVFVIAAIIKAKSFKKNGPGSWKMTAFKKLEFTVSDILECVKDGNVIGRGGAGIVYHGKMPNGVEIAVKKLLGFGANSHDHGFRAEIQTLGNIRHRNIVRLLAFCSNKETNLLVYEYMRNGSLGEALHGKKGAFLSWNFRYKISIDSAKGLCYLHHDCSPLILHRDVKSNNILLSSNFEAHVADFGLAKFLVDGAASECMSSIAGSYGYIAPEYAYTLRVDEKSDVYSFGVVLLELLTGKKPVGDFGEGVDLVQWCKKATNGRREQVVDIIDSRLMVVPKEQAMHMFFIAMLCLEEDSVQRPTMREVVQMLSEFPTQSQQDQQSSSSCSSSINPPSKKLIQNHKLPCSPTFKHDLLV